MTVRPLTRINDYDRHLFHLDRDTALYTRYRVFTSAVVLTVVRTISHQIAMFSPDFSLCGATFILSITRRPVTSCRYAEDKCGFAHARSRLHQAIIETHPITHTRTYAFHSWSTFFTTLTPTNLHSDSHIYI